MRLDSQAYPKLRSIFLVLGLHLLLVFQTAVGSAAEEGRDAESEPRSNSRESTTPRGDMICGPRCLEYLLRYYDKDAPELMDIVRQIQGPNLEEGASLRQLEEYLRNHGLHTRAISVSGDITFQWPHPVLLHLRPRHKNENLGHFAVWLPESTRTQAVLWDGLKGQRTFPTWKLSEDIDVGVLLTSPTPIKSPSQAIVFTTDTLLRYVAYGFLLLQATVTFRLAHWRFKRLYRTC